MPRIIKNTLLNYLPTVFEIESSVNQARIFSLNENPTKTGKIVYLCERELRVNDNPALQFAIQKSKELNTSLKIIHPKTHYNYLPKQKFLDNQLEQIQKTFRNLNFDFEIIDKVSSEIISNIYPALLILDFNPILKRTYLKEVDYKVYEVDGHNIIPVRFVSDKQEYNAATLRRKIYRNIYPFLTEFPSITTEKVEADLVLEEFIKTKLPNYSELKNDPSANVLSNLSKYLNLGFISSQRVAVEVIKADVTKEDKEVFLEELIIRKELSDNFCLYAKNFNDLSGIPIWAKLSLKSHQYDLRLYLYSKEDLEQAKTHDILWNATQTQLKKEGIIHSYLRMYWAKKILEWTDSPEYALKIAIYLNDKYAFDAPSANGYVAILWSIAGLHDRAFMDYPITGKIRRMSYNSIKKKYNLSEYIKRYLLE